MRTLASAFLISVSLLTACGHTEPRGIDRVSSPEPLPYAVNINTADAEELSTVPHIGEKLAGRIIAHREAHGPFRRVEHIMLVEGISDKRFRKIRKLLKAE